MSEKPRVLALVAHPDDIEFMFAGTMLMLQARGWEMHCMTIANGSCGTAVDDVETIVAKRRAEGQAACKLAGAVWHPAVCNDLEVFHNWDVISQVLSVVRDVRVTPPVPAEVEPEAAKCLLPRFSLQPLVENAVHHGIEPRTEPGEVQIDISRIGDRVRVEIVNPLPEATTERSGNHMALSNIRERLALTFDVEGQLDTMAGDGLFRVVVQFPYRKERRRRDGRRTFDSHR